MKKLILLSSLLMSFFAFSAEVDIKKSTFKWKGTKVTGKHMGLIALKSAKLEDKKGVLQTGTIVMDLNKISVTDLEGEWKQKLEGHLKAKDFFNVAKYPTAKLKINKIEKGKIMGDLTIKKDTHAVSIPFKQKGKVYTGMLKFDRTKYGMVYKSGNFFKDLGDKMIHNEVELDFKIVLK